MSATRESVVMEFANKILSGRVPIGAGYDVPTDVITEDADVTLRIARAVVNLAIRTYQRRNAPLPVPTDERIAVEGGEEGATELLTVTRPTPVAPVTEEERRCWLMDILDAVQIASKARWIADHLAYGTVRAALAGAPTPESISKLATMATPVTPPAAQP